MMRPATLSPRPGFTITELLVVMAAAAAVAGIAVPVTRSVLARSREAACLNNLRNLGVALESYLQDHQQVLPSMEAGRASKSENVPVLDVVLLPYVGNPQAFQCPQDAVQFGKSGSSYLWNSTQNGLHVSKLTFFGISDRPDKIALITDKEAWHPAGTNFLYADQTSSNRMRFSTGN